MVESKLLLGNQSSDLNHDARVTLNFDILLHIVLFMGGHRPHLLAAMQTCKTLYAAGIPFLLEPYVSISDADALRSFCIFMLNDPPLRFKHLRVFYLDFRHFHQKPLPSFEPLLRVMKHSTHLEELHVSEAEHMMEVDPRLVGAFSFLKTIKVLYISGYGVHILEMLHCFQSPVKTLKLYNCGDTLPEGLTSLSVTLEELFVMGIEHVEKTIQLPRVKTLDINDIYVHSIEIDTLIYTFPNLENLTLYTNYAISDSEADGYHERNKQEQLVKKWSRLSHLRGELSDIYMLAPTCKVNHLDVTGVVSSRMDMLHQLLEDMKPTRFSVSPSVDEMDTVGWGELISPTLDITHLALYLSFHFSTVDAGTVLDNLSQLLAQLRISYLMIFMPCYKDSSSNYDYLLNMNLEAYARKLMDRAKTLRYVFLDVALDKRLRCYLERGMSSSGDPKLLSMEVGHSVMCEEGFESFIKQT